MFVNPTLAIFSPSFQVAVLALFTLLVSTYTLSLFHFIWTRNSSRPGKPAPTLPYYLPGLYHAFDLGWSVASFLANTVLVPWLYAVVMLPNKYCTLVNAGAIFHPLESALDPSNSQLLSIQVISDPYYGLLEP